MNAGYQGPLSDEPLDNKPHRHDALSGSDFSPGIEDIHPENNAHLEKEIYNIIKSHPEIDSSKVHISFKEGFVSLTGVVSSTETRATIQAIVENIEGIQDVVNFLEIAHG